MDFAIKHDPDWEDVKPQLSSAASSPRRGPTRGAVLVHNYAMKPDPHWEAVIPSPRRATTRSSRASRGSARDIQMKPDPQEMVTHVVSSRDAVPNFGMKRDLEWEDVILPAATTPSSGPSRTPVRPKDRVNPRHHRVSRYNIIDRVSYSFPFDDWHYGKRQMAINRNMNGYPGIWFFPEQYGIVGVSLWMGERGHGLAEPKAIVQHDILSKFPLTHEFLFLIRWPGYEHLDLSYKFSFADVCHHHLVRTICSLLAEISTRIRDFYGRHAEKFNGNGVRLGPGGVPFSDLRMTHIYTRDRGKTWEPEITYIVQE